MLKYYKLKSCFMFNNCLQPNVIKIPSRTHTKTSLAKLCSNCKYLAIVLWSCKNLLIELAAWLWVLWLLATTSYDIQGLRMFVGRRKVKAVNQCFLLLQVLLLCWNAMVPTKNSCNAICNTSNFHLSRGTRRKCFLDYYFPCRAVAILLLI